MVEKDVEISTKSMRTLEAKTVYVLHNLFYMFLLASSFFNDIISDRNQNVRQ